MPNEPKQDQPTPKSSSMNRVSRHNARRYALQAMYQWQLAGTPLTEIEAEFLRYHINEQLDLDYFKELIHGIPNHQDELDQAFRPYLGRMMAEIDPIELGVLRLATFELIKRPDIPYRVIINEALELTKQFGSVEGHKFVNGVLDRVAKKIRETEVNMKKDNG